MIETVSVNGVTRLEFNQPTILPSFIDQQVNSTDTRRLENSTIDESKLSLSKINAEDIFKINILRDMPEDDESNEGSLDRNLRNEFYLSIIEWNENYLDILTNFTYPLEVSNGKYKDRIEINVKNPNIFVSALSKAPLDTQFTKLAKEIPKQLPKGIDG